MKRGRLIQRAPPSSVATMLPVADTPMQFVDDPHETSLRFGISKATGENDGEDDVPLVVSSMPKSPPMKHSVALGQAIALRSRDSVWLSSGGSVASLTCPAPVEMDAASPM
jgi:hypothetical protein